VFCRRNCTISLDVAPGKAFPEVAPGEALQASLACLLPGDDATRLEANAFSA
jgi:hypothetical protein